MIGTTPPQADGEEESLRQAIAGDALSLQALLHHHAGRLGAYVRRFLPPAIAAVHDPEDVLQDTCVEAVRRIRDFRPAGDDAFVRWLLTIARHRMLQLLADAKAMKRGGGVARRLLVDGEDFGGVVGLLDALAVYSRTPSYSAIRHELVGVMQRLLDRLGDDQRLAIRLRHLEGLTAKDAAARMQRTEGAFHLLCNRGLKELRQGLRSKSYYV